ncbi:MAG: prepilin-type N-terminal cleavage/methylation domain-containing protein [Cyanobacteria bacterium P01_H01_bin.130]
MRLNWLRRRQSSHQNSRQNSHHTPHHAARPADSLVRWWLLRSKSRSGDRPAAAGFTLAELLITLIISSIIVAGLLTLVVDLVTTNRKELARTETQREMSIASEYMSSELREAAYVYTGECLWEGDGGTGPQSCPGLFRNGGLAAPGNDQVPIIAFWKLDPLPPTCSAAECDNYAVAQRSYTLVVYFLSKENQGDIWDGDARLTRAELSRFDADGTLGELGTNPDPNSNDATFRNWSANVSRPTLDDIVLVDYVDATPDAQELDANTECPVDYRITPSSTALNAGGFSKVRSVYACVRDDVTPAGGAATNATSSFNQKVVLFVRGNPQGRFGLDAQACGNELQDTLRTERQNLLQGTAGICNLPTVKTEVLNRGVANKVPRQLGGTLPVAPATNP